MAKKNKQDEIPPIDTYFLVDEELGNAASESFKSYWIGYTLQESKGRVDIVKFTSKKKAEQVAIVVTREMNTTREVVAAWLNKNHPG